MFLFDLITTSEYLPNVRKAFKPLRVCVSGRNHGETLCHFSGLFYALKVTVCLVFPEIKFDIIC